MKNWKYGILAFSLLTGIVIICITWPFGGHIQKIRIGYIPFNADLPFFVAVENNYFIEEGLAIEPIRFNEGSEAITALLAGQVDFIAPIAYSVQWPIIQQEPEALRMFIPEFETDRTIMSAVLVKKNSRIKSVEDLKGKKVGTYTGIPQLLYLKLFLHNIGLDPEKDVRIIQVGTSLQVQSLEAEQFDALFTVEPFVTIAKEEIDARVLIANPRSKYILNPFPMGAALVSSDFLKKHPDIVRKVYNATAKAVDFINVHPQEAKKTLPKFTPMTPDIADKSNIYETFKIGDDSDMTVIQKLADILFEYKYLDRQLETAKIFLTEEEIGP
jgi:NitT/TauT family transport system substrate-binding protein